MATNEPTNLPFNNFQQFDTVATQILQTFQTLIEQLIVRRDALLHKLSQLREDYTNKETTRLEAIRELEKTRQQLEEMSLKVNKNIPIHQQATQLYQEGLDNLQTPTKLLYPLFQCQTLTSLQSAVSGFGDVLEWELQWFKMANHGKWIVSVEIDMANVLSMYRISTLRQRLVKSNFSYGFSFINYDVISQWSKWQITGNG